MMTPRQFVYAGCMGLLIALTCMGVAQIPHCENVAMLMLPGTLIATGVALHSHGYGPSFVVILACLVNAFFYGFFALLVVLHRSNKSTAKASVLIAFVAMSALTGCTSAPAPTPTTSTQPTAQYPPRPTTPPTPIKLFHQTKDSITLTTTETATDDQIIAILYQLHDAAHAHTFDTLHIPQAAVDARAPYMWFHIYRVAKCASEKYTAGKLPCDASYHAAADYTLGSYSNPNRDDATIYTGPDRKETHLWNPDKP